MLHLVTGYAGEEHITSADQGAYNMATFGEGEFVLDRGNKFEATVVSNNLITIADGEAMMQGRFIKMIIGTTEEAVIENGTQEMNRNDLICLRYEKDGSTNIETASLVVKKGTETSGEPTDPEYVQGDITDGLDLVNEMPLYRVTLNGLNIATVTKLFTVQKSATQMITPEYEFIAESIRPSGDRIASGEIYSIKTYPFSNPKMTFNEIKATYKYLKVKIFQASRQMGVDFICDLDDSDPSSSSLLYATTGGEITGYSSFNEGSTRYFLPRMEQICCSLNKTSSSEEATNGGIYMYGGSIKIIDSGSSYFQQLKFRLYGLRR